MKKINKHSSYKDIERFVITENGYILDTYYDEEGKERRMIDYDVRIGWTILWDEPYEFGIKLMRDTIVMTGTQEEVYKHVTKKV